MLKLLQKIENKSRSATNSAIQKKNKTKNNNNPKMHDKKPTLSLNAHTQARNSFLNSSPRAIQKAPNNPHPQQPQVLQRGTNKNSKNTKPQKTLFDYSKLEKDPRINTVTYGSLTTNKTGTFMKAKLLNKPTGGSKPKEYPKNWEGIFDFAIGSLSARFIRGHLLNDNLGGPGVQMNLVPLTRHANHLHESKVEKEVKDHLKNKNNFADYDVVPNYGDPGPIKSEIDSHIQNQMNLDFYKNKTNRDAYINSTIPEKLDCTWTLYSKDNNDKIQFTTSKRTVVNKFD